MAERIIIAVLWISLLFICKIRR